MSETSEVRRVCRRPEGSNIAELWGDHQGVVYYRLSNWGGFYQTVGGWGSGHVDVLPEEAFLLMQDGIWLRKEIPLAALLAVLREREPLRNDQWVKGYWAALHDVDSRI
jgi:hypothetical protein